MESLRTRELPGDRPLHARSSRPRRWLRDRARLNWGTWLFGETGWLGSLQPARSTPRARHGVRHEANRIVPPGISRETRTGQATSSLSRVRDLLASRHGRSRTTERPEVHSI